MFTFCRVDAERLGLAFTTQSVGTSLKKQELISQTDATFETRLLKIEETESVDGMASQEAVAATQVVQFDNIEQLKKGGRMVIPVGTRFQVQYLTLVEKDMQGKVTSRQLLPVAFVPFTGGH